MKYKILVADDNVNFMKGLGAVLHSHLDIEVTFVDNVKECLEVLHNNANSFAAVVLDFHFEKENANGADLAADLLRINPRLQVIICTGDYSQNPMLASLRARVTDFIPKSELDLLVERIRKCFAHYDETMRIFNAESPSEDRQQENKALLASLGIIGCSDAMRDVYEIVHRSAPQKATVLIRGECGTGKELVAKAFRRQKVLSAS